MNKKPAFELKKNLVAIVNSSVGSRMFRKCNFKIKGKSIEVLDDGDLACAFYVSTILKIFSLIKDLHTTVNGTEKDMVESGWKKIQRPKIGCVIIYAPKKWS